MPLQNRCVGSCSDQASYRTVPQAKWTMIRLLWFLGVKARVCPDMSQSLVGLGSSTHREAHRAITLQHNKDKSPPEEKAALCSTDPFLLLRPSRTARGLRLTFKVRGEELWVTEHL